ncbi:MAG: DUF924 family protein [Deltaproteobacteria bacterium]|nr:DUF924 family protein [Deltaproteobacteria bacterium]
MASCDLAEIHAILDAHPGGIVAFDCDGTLWSGDVGDDWFDQLTLHEGLSEVAHAAVCALAQAHGVATDGDAGALGARLIAAAHAGEFPEDALYSMMAWAAAGRDLAACEAIAERTFARFGLAERVLDETKQVLDAARARGCALVAVSASPKVVIACALKRLGIEVEAICAAEARWVDGVMSTELVSPLPYGEQKATLLRAQARGRAVALVLGDSAFDGAMMLLAAQGLMVRPKPALRAFAQANVGESAPIRELAAVHHEHEQVLDFWFGPAWRKGRAAHDPRWFVRSEAYDEAVRDTLLGLHIRAREGALSAWRERPDACVALVILLDQVPRNVFRGKAESFATDALALATARHAVSQGFDKAIAWLPRSFFYLPYMHCESLSVQHESVAHYTALTDIAGKESQLSYALSHRESIAKFGRFPGRNEALGRESTPAERDAMG